MSSQEDINPDSSPDSPDAPPMSPKQQEAMFEPKPTPKIIRVLTVMAYVLSVSMAAILLSIYYIFMWEGKPHLGARAGGGGYERNLSIYPLVEGPKYSRYHQNEAEHHRNSSATETSSSHQFLDHNTSNNSDGYFDVGNGSSIPLHINTTQNPEVPEGSTNKSLSKRSVEEVYPFITDTMHNEEAEMQQQFTAVESRPSDVMVSPSPESEAEENVTWPDDYESLEEFKKSSVFIKKLMSQYDY